MLDIPIESIIKQVQLALDEDIGTGDMTAELIDENHVAKAELTFKSPGILCGQPWFEQAFYLLDPSMKIQWHYNEGAWIEENTIISFLTGNARAMLTAERTAINFLQTLSGTATQTHQYTAPFKDHQFNIYDTRKTIPGLRLAQKYAVTCGGGKNHRIGLYDAYLIKENHIMAAGSITLAINKAKALNPNLPIIVEVESVDEFKEALQQQPDVIMLDNFTTQNIKIASRFNEQSKKPVDIEVSGNISKSMMNTLTDVTVHRVSIGALTKHIQAIDISLRVVLD